MVVGMGMLLFFAAVLSVLLAKLVSAFSTVGRRIVASCEEERRNGATLAWNTGTEEGGTRRLRNSRRVILARQICSHARARGNESASESIIPPRHHAPRPSPQGVAPDGLAGGAVFRPRLPREWSRDFHGGGTNVFEWKMKQDDPYTTTKAHIKAPPTPLPLAFCLLHNNKSAEKATQSARHIIQTNRQTRKLCSVQFRQPTQCVRTQMMPLSKDISRSKRSNQSSHQNVVGEPRRQTFRCSAVKHSEGQLVGSL